jgi:peptidoglycan/LPS O-acetylase OafA/YrhL
MASAMQLYAGFALLVIAIIAIIVLAALVSNLIGAVRRRFGRTRFRGARAHDDFSATASRSRPAPGSSATPASRSDNPTAPR